jgi:hypothetical protein
MPRSASTFRFASHRFAFLASSLLLALASCKDSEPGLTGKCADLDAYTTTAAAPSFATAVFPILSNTELAKGCAQATICHGTPSTPIDAQGTKTLTFVGDAATVKSTLLTATPVNAPSMKLVVPNDVGSSFLAYKISKADGLACVNAMCVSGASPGASKPCGDPMPTLGMLSDAERTTILDWIAKGAAN